MPNLHAIRGSILHFIGDPGDDSTPIEHSVDYHEDGILLIEDGRIKALDAAATLLPQLKGDISIDHYPDQLIMPGFIDAHVHFAQLGIIASYGRQLLDWLNNYTFPEESRFASVEYAQKVAELFVNALVSHGTTTAMVFATNHAHSIDALFSAATQLNMRLMSGKMLMDRNAPEALLDNVETGLKESRELLERWHHTHRIEYVLSPRFAPTSTPEQLKAAGQFLDDYPGILMQTHMSENRAEIAWVKELYPDSHDYLDVYARAGLLRDRCFFGHAIHIDDSVRQRLNEAKAGITVCPTSNLFLGSGLFDWKAARDQEVRIALGSDIGAGTSLSQLQTLQDTYKLCQLQGVALSPWQAFYQLTQGSAKSLGIEHLVGNFEIGKEADVVVLDTTSTPLMACKRSLREATLQEKLFDLMILGDDRSILATYLMGDKRYSADN